MARRRTIPKYKTVELNGITYYRTRIEDADGKRVALYGKTREELYDKVEEAKRQIENLSFQRDTPTVKEYCEKWLLMQSAHIRATTLTDYSSKVKNYIIKPLGHLYMADVTADDLKLAIVPAAKKSESVYRSVNMLMKSIFSSAEESHLIDENPARRISAKGGIPQKKKDSLTDEQTAQLLEAIQGLPPYVFVMLGLYAGLRREEILALQWDCVFLDEEAPYLSVKRAWHTEHNRPVILTELKTKAAQRDIPPKMSCGVSAGGQGPVQFSLCHSKQRGRPSLLHPVQARLAVYRDKIHQGAQLYPLRQRSEAQTHGHADSRRDGAPQRQSGLQSGFPGHAPHAAAHLYYKSHLCPGGPEDGAIPGRSRKQQNHYGHLCKSEV